jgi:DNA repair protein RecO (recombination protein O)
MADKLHKTKGIVLRTVKYGETSVIVSMFTELFGIQSYLVNGVRTHSKKGSGKANLFQPSAILDLVVYHHETKQLNRIREFRWAFIYQHVLTDVKKNAVALFMVELVTRSIKQPEPQTELFHFIEDSLVHLDGSSDTVMANFPLFFALHIPSFLGFRIDDNYSEQTPWLDLQEGNFVAEQPRHPDFLGEKHAAITSQLLRTMQPGELNDLLLHHDFRRQLLHAFETYYALHVSGFGRMKSLQVLKEIL